MYRFYKQALSTVACSLLLVAATPYQQAQAQSQVEQAQVPMQPQPQGADDAYVSYQDFYQDLAPYGQWVDDPQYGYVWTPNVNSDFRPYYTNGHWVMTQYGNTWASDFAWGWAPFHYGRWTYDDYYGWVWIPGSEWGPAWVSWRYGEGNYGWAPLGPGYAFNSVYGDYSCPADWWVFIPQQYIYTGNYYHYWYGPRNNQTIINNTTVINNTYENNHITYVAGPRANQIEAVTHQPVKVYHLANSSSNTNTRVHNDVVKMYRPMEVKAVADNGPKPTPPNVIRAPQPIRTPTEISSHSGAAPTFKSDAPRNNTPPATAPGTTHYNNEPAKTTPTENGNRPYQWDVNRPQPQHTQPVQQEQPRQQPAPQRAPQPVRQQAAPQPMRSAPAPQPMRSAPAPQPMRSAPAPAPRQAGGGGRR